MINNKYPLGISDFAEIVEIGATLIDKTMFVKDIMENYAKAILITRPRRFGKTLAMTMLGEFLKIDGKDVFGGLHIANETQFCQKHKNQYPVISISFKDCKDLDFEGVFEQLKAVFSACYKSHQYLLESLSLSEKQEFEAFLNEKVEDPHKLSKALSNLISHLHTNTGKNVVVLIDEYDSPIHSAYEHGFYEKMVAFMRKLLGSALKDNPHLEKSVLTGICRVSQKSLFSRLNHVRCYTVLDSQYAGCFGFTQDEVDSLILPIYDHDGASLSSRGQGSKDLPLEIGGEQIDAVCEREVLRFALDDKEGSDKAKDLSQRIKNWYNGYAIGGT